MYEKEKLSLLGWLIYGGLAILFSFLVVTIAHFNNIFVILLGLLYVIFNGIIIWQLMKLLDGWDDIDFEKPIISQKNFECWFIVNLTLIITNYLLIPNVDKWLMQPLIFFFAIFEFLIIVMTINGVVVCFGDHFRYWFFRWFQKIKRLELFKNIHEINKLLTVSSNDQYQLKNEQKIKTEQVKSINLKKENSYKKKI